ncbi:4'-phosphopantetheinyl transferase superfamily protein [Streptosporangium sp. NBC_01755]|uniref:4'-phosphopantetheinyl transferase family protein n=1 Tax=unclassified Streptosporangium TaxID=2632669 RepID=UPI002DD7FF59|nr:MULTISPECIES: 4'-phosphopantetheinyl transferase superfamily protein [unclassified Streptosporangium]WSA28367.1 4'-phosphopantetheinyl transferase superfamily protein [Streptosporangium sp. NBC_01810]WSD00143.1 4'-phosphopantetheinyl transferase superfamily protein [Streptosporangium sp. NBC_01755]
MIEKILPPWVASAESFDDPPGVTLFPEEEAVIARAVDKRRREFTTARHCARQALARIGLPPTPILPGERGAPGWPGGVVGAITHCVGYRAAAVSRDALTVGIDAEPHEPLPEGVLDAVSLDEERAAIARLDRGVHWDRLLFSAKESVYKAWFPLARRWLGFEEAHLVFDPSGTFTARLLVPGPLVAGRELTGFTGRWLVADGLAVTSIAVPDRPAP